MDISDESSMGEEEEVLRIVEDTDIQPTGKYKLGWTEC